MVLASTVKELSVKGAAMGWDAVEAIAVVRAWVEKILTDLKVQHKRVPCGKDEISLFVTAIENSWIHLRRKKRERIRQLRELPRASEDTLQAMEEEKNSQKSVSNNSDCENPKAEDSEMGFMAPDEDVQMTAGDEQPEESAAKEEHSAPVKKEEMEAKQGETSLGKGSGDVKEEPCPSEEASNPTVEKEPGPKETSGGFLFECLMNVKKEVNDVVVEMHWVKGQNRDLMNQLCTYLRNQILRLVAS